MALRINLVLMICSSEEVDFLKAELFARKWSPVMLKPLMRQVYVLPFETWGVSGDVEEYLASTEKNEAGTKREI